MGGRPKKRLTGRLEFDLKWASLDEKKQDDLIRLSEQGKHVSLIEDEPEIPYDVSSIYSAYLELRNATAGDKPVAFGDRFLAWQLYGDVDLDMFVRFVSALDSVWMRTQNEAIGKKSLEGSKRRAAEAAAKRLKAGPKQIGSTPPPKGRRK